MTSGDYGDVNSRRWLQMALAACAFVALVVIISALVEMTREGSDSAFANAFGRSGSTEGGGYVTISTKENLGSSVYFSPVILHNYLNVPVKVTSLSLAGVRGPARSAGLYQVVQSCHDSIEPLDEYEPGFGWGARYHLRAPQPFWLPGKSSPPPPCGRVQKWVDKFSLYKLGVVTTTGFDITYQVNGSTYRDFLPGMRFKVVVIRGYPPSERRR